MIPMVFISGAVLGFAFGILYIAISRKNPAEERESIREEAEHWDRQAEEVSR
jgi:membrane associated rhomboid family serine protease